MTKELTAEQLAILDSAYPVSDDNSRPQFPRFGMLAKDITEETGTGKKKTIKIIESAGTFFTERDLGEKNEEGKKVWTKEFIKEENPEVVIIFHRRQLRRYDQSLEKFYSTPIFDNAEQIIPLYLDKQVIARGTMKELQAKYPALSQKGKPTSSLKDETILYVVYNGELFQCNLSQSSKWEFMSYKKSLNPSTVITALGSHEETNGSNVYHKMTFTKKRLITSGEFDVVNEGQTLLKDTVAANERFYLQSGTQTEDQKQIEKESKDF